MDDPDHICILKTLNYLPFQGGKKFLSDILRGVETDSIKKNRLNKIPTYGSLGYSKEEIGELVDRLIMAGFIRIVSSPQNKFWKLLELTAKGCQEMRDPVWHNKKTIADLSYHHVTQEDFKQFEQHKEFLALYNDEQKKAITDPSEKILCIAGAGSGKTSVLTKRIEFLVNIKGVDPSKILAITFTKKARFEMKERLDKNSVSDVQVHTFNSFSEQILRKYESYIYEQEMEVISFGEKISLLKKSLEAFNYSIPEVITLYYGSRKNINKTNDQLFIGFMNDCFSFRDYLKSKHQSLNDLNIDDLDYRHKRVANLVFKSLKYVEAYMRKKGLRDFSDQLFDCISFLKKSPEFVPNFDYILIDEYQDINETQIKLIDILNSTNIFAVGDPRQSIYGWRGSDINFILGFPEKYSDSTIINLVKNYRSKKKIVEISNLCLKNMGLANLESNSEDDGIVKLVRLRNDSEEFRFVISEIERLEKEGVPLEEIFVLARTNRMLTDLAELLVHKGISHMTRNEDSKAELRKGYVLLATVHAVKGLEAKVVFVIGCSSQNFPIKVSDHPILEVFPVENYDKEEEERRLLYVALSRAKDELYVCYTANNPSFFINAKMKKVFNESKILKIQNTQYKVISGSNSLVDKLRTWRSNLAKQMKVPAFVIFNDATMMEICRLMPLSLGDLEEITGLGPIKIRRYGKDILDIINGIR